MLFINEFFWVFFKTWLYYIPDVRKLRINIPITKAFPPLRAFSMLLFKCLSSEKLCFNAFKWFSFDLAFFSRSSFFSLCFFFSCPFAQLFRQYLHQSFLLSRAGDFGSASLAGRDCSASGLDDAPSGLTNEFRVRFPPFSLSLSLYHPSPTVPCSAPSH